MIRCQNRQEMKQTKLDTNSLQEECMTVSAMVVYGNPDGNVSSPTNAIINAFIESLHGVVCNDGQMYCVTGKHLC